MSVGETARLISSLEMRDAGFTRTADSAIRKTSALEGSLGRLGRTAGKGLQTAARNLTRIGIGLGAAAAVGITAGVKSGIDSLITLENATTQVEGAIKQMGQQGRISAAEIQGWANQIEASVDSAFDDKDIFAASANLIRYGNVAPKALRETLVVATDLAAKMGGGEGSVQKASIALAKSLANPTKATRLLAQAGVNLTEKEQKRLKQLMEANKLHKAQEFLIDRVRKKTDGAADSLNGKTADALNNWNDALEEVNKALATSFLPLMTDVANFLSDELAKPETMAMIKTLGTNLANAGRELFDFAKRIPWKAIGDGLKTAADWAGKLFDAFRNLPPEVQAMIIGLAGLNKLSGGAITGVIGGLAETVGKVIGNGLKTIFAAHVTVTGPVTGTPVPGAGPTGPASGPTSRMGRLGGALATIAKVTLVGIASGVAFELAQALADQSTQISEQGRGLVNSGNQNVGSMTTGELRSAIANIDRNVTGDLGNQIALAITNPFNHAADNIQATYDLLKSELGKREEADAIQEFRKGERATREGTTKTSSGLKLIDQKQAAALVAFRAGERTTATGLGNTQRAAQTAGAVSAMASTNAGSRVASAIERKDMSADLSVTTNVYVTATSVRKAVTVDRSYNPGTSADGGRDRSGSGHHNAVPT